MDRGLRVGAAMSTTSLKTMSLALLASAFLGVGCSETGVDGGDAGDAAPLLPPDAEAPDAGAPDAAPPDAAPDAASPSCADDSDPRWSAPARASDGRPSHLGTPPPVPTDDALGRFVVADLVLSDSGDDNVMAAWVLSDRGAGDHEIWSSWRGSTDTWDEPRRIAAYDENQWITEIHVSAGAAGGNVLWQTAQQSLLRSVSFSVDTGWSETTALWTGSDVDIAGLGARVRNSAIAVDTSGRMVAVWLQTFTEPAHAHIWVREGDLATGWGRLNRTIVEGPSEPYTGQLWAGFIGDGAFALWTRYGADRELEVVSSFSNTDGTWSPPTTVAGGLLMPWYGGPSVAWHPSGGILVAWQHTPEPLGVTRVSSVVYTPSRGWGEVTPVAEDVRHPCPVCDEGAPGRDDLRLAVIGACGDAAIVFAERSAGGEGVDLLASVRRADGSWWPAQRIAGPDTNSGNGPPSVFRTSDGSVYAYWRQYVAPGWITWESQLRPAAGGP